MRQLIALTLVACTLGLGQTSRPSYLPEEYPNPQIRPRDCGFSGTKAGYICDPAGIITRHQLETINWFLEGIANTENPAFCPCSRYHCEHGPRPRFYKVAVALVPKLKLPLDSSNREVRPVDQAQIFAYRLENDLWNISSCQEDIVILYSRDDQTLVTMTGEVAGRRLDPYSRKVIHSIVGPHFAEGRIHEGLLRMIYEIELVLNGNDYYRGMQLAQVSDSAVSTFSSALLALCAMVLVRTLVC